MKKLKDKESYTRRVVKLCNLKMSRYFLTNYVSADDSKKKLSDNSIGLSNNHI